MSHLDRLVGAMVVDGWALVPVVMGHQTGECSPEEVVEVLTTVHRLFEPRVVECSSMMGSRKVGETRWLLEGVGVVVAAERLMLVAYMVL
jgi:hypothetical protein